MNRYAAKLLLRYGKKKHIDTLVHHPDHLVRKDVAVYGTEEHRKQLTNDKNLYVKFSVLTNTLDKDIIRHFINDPERSVRSQARWILHHPVFGMEPNAKKYNIADKENI